MKVTLTRDQIRALASLCGDLWDSKVDYTWDIAQGPKKGWITARRFSSRDLPPATFYITPTGSHASDTQGFSIRAARTERERQAAG